MIRNRDAFLKNIAEKLGREVRTVPEAKPVPVNDYAQTRFSDLNADQLVDMFFKIGGGVNLADCRTTTAKELPETLIKICAELGDGDIVLSGEKALRDLGVTPEVLGPSCWLWGSKDGRKNAEDSSNARTGIVWAENALAESGTMVLFSSVGNGRSVSLLPQNTIFVVKKSAVLPRLGKLTVKLHQMHEEGKTLPSCINLIGGPSSTADIELVKVVGVHGPLKAVYLVVNDL